MRGGFRGGDVDDRRVRELDACKEDGKQASHAAVFPLFLKERQ